MTKHPIVSAFVMAVVIVVVLAFVFPFSTQESPWALSFIVVIFPFIWFLAWLVTNAGAWLQSSMSPEERQRGADEDQETPH
jgi:hypothetical protein